MEDNLTVYQDIAKRTDGDIYVGVVGPVRTGKSTFIKRFMDLLVIPNINNEYKRERALDELPQSASGRTIMTTEPKFIPNEAVEIVLGENIKLKARMVDCVGYLVDNAIGYYNVQIVILMITTINNTFIAIEKSKGNTIKLLALNLGVIFIKIGLSTLFAFGPFENVTVTWLALATMIAQLFMFCFGIVFCFIPSNILRISIKSLNLDKQNCLGIFKLAFPVFIGRFLFSFGKVYVNSAATTVYGKTCVGALGISNTMAGLITNCVNSFEDGGSTIVSQNYGNSNGRRIQRFFFTNLAVLSILSLAGSIIMFVLKENIAEFFAGDDQVYKEMIINIFKWECMDLFFSGLTAAAQSYFYGFGMTKITMAISMSTLFAFRIPTLLILMYGVKMNYEACGIAMFVSNTLTGIIAIAITLAMVIRLPRSKKYKCLF